MKYIFYYSEYDQDHEILTRVLPLEEHRIGLVNIRDLNLPDDVESAFLMGRELLTDVVLLQYINGKRIKVAPSLEEIKSNRVDKASFLKMIDEFFMLNALDDISKIVRAIDSFEKAKLSFAIHSKEGQVEVPKDISYEDFKAFLYMIKYLGFYNVELTR